LLDELHGDFNGVGGSKCDEGGGLVGLGSATSGHVGEGTDNDVRYLLLVTNESHSSTFHFNRANIKLVVDKTPICCII